MVGDDGDRVMNDEMERRAYKDLLKFSWFAAISAVILMGVSIYVMGSGAASILTTGVPVLLAMGGVRDYLEKRGKGDSQ